MALGAAWPLVALITPIFLKSETGFLIPILLACPPAVGIALPAMGFPF